MSFSSLFEAFRYQVRSHGDRTAVVAETPDRSTIQVTWRQLAGMVQVAAKQLEDCFRRDASLPRHVGYQSDNRLGDLVLALACMSIGAVEFPFDHRLADIEIARRWKPIGGVWIDDSIRSRFCDLANRWQPSFDHQEHQQVDPVAPSLVLWTSGTTGTPRGVTLSFRNLAGNAAAKLAAVPQSRDDLRLCVLPLSHAYARTCDFGTWLLSGCVLAISVGYAGLERLAPLVRPSLINAVPSIASWMLENPNLAGLDRLRLLGCGGAAMSDSAFEAWRQRGVTVIQGYGLTETAPVICSATPKNARAGHVGQFVDGWEAEIRDQQLFVRGPHVMLGYWKDPEATAKRIDPNGWLATGDLVEMDAASEQLRILGRNDDVIVLDTARKLHPATVERAVGHVPGVQNAMLLDRQQLELWFDADDDFDSAATANAIRGVLDQIDGLKRCTIERFQPPLSSERGELTAKGTIRRQRILETRFSDQAGS